MAHMGPPFCNSFRFKVHGLGQVLGLLSTQEANVLCDPKAPITFLLVGTCIRRTLLQHLLSRVHQQWDPKFGNYSYTNP